MVGVVGAFRAVGMGNRVGAAAVLVATILGMYAIAYIYHAYYGISTPIVNLVLASGEVLIQSLFNSHILRAGNVEAAAMSQLVNYPFSNGLLNALYYIGMFTYTTVIALALVSTSTLMSIARFIGDLIRRR